MIPGWTLIGVETVAIAVIIITPLASRLRRRKPALRPRLGRRGMGPPIEHIPQPACLDCIDWWDDDGQPIRIHCLVHDVPDPSDDLSLWDAELGQPRVLRLRAWKDQLR